MKSQMRLKNNLYNPDVGFNTASPNGGFIGKCKFFYDGFASHLRCLLMLQSHNALEPAVTATPTVKGIIEEAEIIKVEALATLLASNPIPEARPNPAASPAVSRTASRLLILPRLYFLAFSRAAMPPQTAPTAIPALSGLIVSTVIVLTAPTPRPMV